jgi:WD40 repeat protein
VDISGHALRGHAHWVMGVSFSLDGAMLASASYDRSVRVWDVTQKRPLHVFNGHKDRVTSVCFLTRRGKGEGNGEEEDCEFVASGSYDKQIKIWDLKTGKSHGASEALASHAAEIKSVCAGGRGLGGERGHTFIASVGSHRKVVLHRI